MGAQWDTQDDGGYIIHLVSVRLFHLFDACSDYNLLLPHFELDPKREVSPIMAGHPLWPIKTN